MAGVEASQGAVGHAAVSDAMFVLLSALLIQVSHDWTRTDGHKCCTLQCMHVIMSGTCALYVVHRLPAGGEAPSWWGTLQACLRWALNLTVNFESEEDTTASPDTPLGTFRSAGLVAALQTSTVSALVHILKRVVRGSIGAVRDGRCAENGIIFGSLIAPATKSLLRLVDHKDKHIKVSALKSIVCLPDLLAVIHECFAREEELPTEMTWLQEAVSAVTAEIITLFQSLLHRDRVAEADSLRTIVDCLVNYSSQSACRKSQVCCVRICEW